LNCIDIANHHALKMDSAKNSQRDIIFFLWKEGATGADISQRLRDVFGSDALGKTVVYDWIQRFREGQSDTNDAPRSGRPRTSLTDENIRRVQMLIEEERRITVREISYATGINICSVHHILKENLNMSKLCARWIPRLLTQTQKNDRTTIAKTNLKLADRDPSFMERIVTVDETWICCYDPESKEQSKVWLPRGSDPPLKAKVYPSVGKVMATVFWDAEGILLVDYLEKGLTINSEYYSNLLRNDLRNALRKKRPGKLTMRPLLLHDNARPHTARNTVAVLKELGWDLMLHPPYSPDLAPSDFHLFPRLKETLRGQRFGTFLELKSEVDRCTRAMSAGFFTRGFEKLLDRYHKCIDLNGDYVEKCTLVNEDD
jgi:histone-lysine N-methyltransferase SETMAR